MEADQRAHVEVGEDIAVHDQKGVVDPTVGSGEGDGAGGVQRRGLDGVAEPDAPGPILGKGAEEGVRSVAERQQRLLHAVGGQVGEHALDHGLLDHGEQLLGGGVGEGSKARSLAPDQYDSPHGVRPYRDARGLPAARCAEAPMTRTARPTATTGRSNRRQPVVVRQANRSSDS